MVLLSRTKKEVQQVDFVTLEALEKLNLRFPDDMIEPDFVEHCRIRVILWI